MTSGIECQIYKTFSPGMASAAILHNQAPTGHVEKLLADTSFQSYMPDIFFHKKGLALLKVEELPTNQQTIAKGCGTVSIYSVTVFKIYLECVRDKSRALYLENKWFLIESGRLKHIQSQHKCHAPKRYPICDPSKKKLEIPLKVIFKRKKIM